MAMGNVSAQVVLMGLSAGAIGTEANCDLVAETLHAANPGLRVKCVSDSGTLYPLHTHSPGCSPQLLFYLAYSIWDGVSDESCLAAHPDGLACVR